MMMIALDLFIWAWNNSLESIPNSLHFPLSLVIKSINMIAISFWGRKVSWDMDKQFKWASNHLTALTNPLVIRLAQSASQRASLKNSGEAWGFMSSLSTRLPAVFRSSTNSCFWLQQSQWQIDIFLLQPFETIEQDSLFRVNHTFR